MKVFSVEGPIALIADFDGTITELDVVDSLLARYAKGRDWIEAEREWADGNISSWECLKRQLACVRISKAELDRFLRSVALDRGFLDLLEFLHKEGVSFSVLSDGFDLFIGRIFELNGVGDIRFRANRLVWRDRRLIPSFPHKKHSCGHCAHCKRSTIREVRPAPKHLIFIGDGQSDICAASVSDTVFAKGKLADHCQKINQRFVPYKSLRDVVGDLPRLLKIVRRNVGAAEWKEFPMTDAQKIRVFIRRRAARDKRRKIPEIRSQTKLFGNVLDSFGILELIAYVEEAFDIPLNRAEVKPANFDTLDKIVAFVAARKKGARRKRV